MNESKESKLSQYKRCKREILKKEEEERAMRFRLTKDHHSEPQVGTIESWLHDEDRVPTSEKGLFFVCRLTSTTPISAVEIIKQEGKHMLLLFN
jgi:hypothetical protein